jgi:hypothetical protein
MFLIVLVRWGQQEQFYPVWVLVLEHRGLLVVVETQS